MSNPLNLSTSPESICLKAFILVLGERSINISIYAEASAIAKEEETAADCGVAVARCGNINRRHLDLMAKVIQGMGYTGEQGGAILDFFKSRVV
jgi:hypothetical protein